MDFTKLTNILFLDIETVSQHPDFSDLDERYQRLWTKKAAMLKAEAGPDKVYKEKAAIYAEFGRILVIGIGQFVVSKGELGFNTRVFASPKESTVLEDFSQFLKKGTKKEITRLCAHNGKEFDYPYLCRRFLVHDKPLPELLQIMGKKPWETNHLLDTMEMWKFGDLKAYTSLEVMAATLGVPTSKDDIDGSEVGRVFYETGDVKRIATYCQKDVAVMGQVFLRLHGFGHLKPEKIKVQG